MKKKPPPGATLIARLKEQRLAREAELARRQSGAESPEESAATPAVEPAVKAEPAGAVEPATKVEPSPEPTRQPESELTLEHAEVTEFMEASVQPEPEVERKSKSKGSAGSKAAAVADSGAPSNAEHVEVTVIEPTIKRSEPGHMMVRTANGKPADLLHREIDIGDLRPNTDDYQILTEEIRLAGRFAAVGLIAQGLRLARLKHDALYKEHYQTFEDYCRKEHQMSGTYAYRLIRMSEMAERMAELGGSLNAAAMPDPFEVMLSLGHRHLMALLPLEPEAAQELLVRGIPVNEAEDGAERVPISRATEKQIREALKVFTGEPGTSKVVPKKALASEKQLIPALSKLVEMLEDWSLWLGGEPPAELEAARMGRGQLLNRLAKRFRTASGKIADALEGDEAK